MKKIEFFKVEGDKINRIRRYCPKCGSGIFLAEHKNRFSCGKCGYTEFKGGGRKESQPPKVDRAQAESAVQEVTTETPEQSKEKSEGEIPLEPETPVEEPSAEEEIKESQFEKPPEPESTEIAEKSPEPTEEPVPQPKTPEESIREKLSKEEPVKKTPETEQQPSKEQTKEEKKPSEKPSQESESS